MAIQQWLHIAVLFTPWLVSSAFAVETIRVNPAKPLGLVSPDILGSNVAACWMARVQENPGQPARLLREAGIRNLRIPGGSISDDYNWKTGRRWYAPQKKEVDFPYSVQPEAFYRLWQSAGTTGLVSVNLAMRPEQFGKLSLDQKAQFAAEWVREINIKRKLRVRYWEVGNEASGWRTVNLGDANNADRQAMTPELYATMFRTYYKRMKAVDPTILVLGPCIMNWNHWSTPAMSGVKWSNDRWARVFIEKCGDIVDVFSFHYYGNIVAHSTRYRQDRIKAAGLLIEATRHFRNLFKKYHLDRAAKVRFALTEYNTDSGMKGAETPEGMMFNALLVYGMIHEGFIAGNHWVAIGPRRGSLINYKDFKPQPQHALYGVLGKFAFGGERLACSTSAPKLKVVAARDASRITVLAYNIDPQRATDVVLKGVAPTSSREAWTWSGQEPKARKHGQPGRPFRLPPLSVTCIVVSVPASKER